LKIVLTGATGFVGSHIVDKLTEMDAELICIHRESSNTSYLEDKGINLFQSGLLSVESLAEPIKGADYVLHIAGSIFARNKDEYLEGNRDTTKTLIEAIKKYSPGIKRFFYLSSQTVSGPSDSLENPVDENSPLNPITAYAESKLEAEKVILENGEIPYTIIRAPALYGPRDKSILSFFKFVNVSFGPLIGFKEKYISLLHAYDIRDAIIDATFSDNTVNEIYMVSSEEYYGWSKLINKLQKAMGRKYIFKLRAPHWMVYGYTGIAELISKILDKPTVVNTDKARDLTRTFWTCSFSKAKRDFGFSQKVSLDEGFAETVKWYKKHKWLK
jgi:nucleoside-diphosphate-sugar epimerase